MDSEDKWVTTAVTALPPGWRYVTRFAEEYYEHHIPAILLQRKSVPTDTPGEIFYETRAVFGADTFGGGYLNPLCEEEDVFFLGPGESLLGAVLEYYGEDQEYGKQKYIRHLEVSNRTDELKHLRTIWGL